MARSFERKMGDAVLDEAGEDRVQFDRVRRCVLERLCAALADLAPSVRTPVAIVAPGWSASLAIATLVPSDTPSVTRTR